MEDYQQRVIEERKVLETKIGRLDTFTRSEKHDALPTKDQELLREQLSYMRSYSDVLRRRIEMFT